MSDFSGKWKAAQGDGRLIMRRLSHGDSQNVDTGDGIALFGGALCDGEQSGSQLLESTIEQLEEAASNGKVTDDSVHQLKQFIEASHDLEGESHLTILTGCMDVGGNGITGSFAMGDLSKHGEFAFLLQDENEFLGGLTCEPSQSFDGWWMRQNIRRKIQLDNPNEFD